MRFPSCKLSLNAHMAHGKHQTHQGCCGSTGVSQTPLAASVVRCVLLCSKRPGFWINCISLLRPPPFFVIFCFPFLLKHKAFQGREYLSLHFWSILQNRNLPMVLGTLGTAGCNLWAREGGETHLASLEPAEPVQLRKSHRGASGAPCSERSAIEQPPSLSFSLCLVPG